MFDPREERINEMERMLSDYQEKLDSVTTNYEEKVHILEKRLVDTEMEISPERHQGGAGMLQIIKHSRIAIKTSKIIHLIYLYTLSFSTDMLDSLDSVVDRDESPTPSSFPLGPGYPQSPIKVNPGKYIIAI